jgi:alanine racemase
MVERKFLSNTWIEISEAAYLHNLNFFRTKVGTRPELSVVIKANAYGHGWQTIARIASKHGVDSFCVHSLNEALKLRHAGFNQNILVMGHIPLNCLSDAIRNNLRVVVYNRETLEKLHILSEKLGKLVRIHLKLETGTYRQGIDQNDLPWFLEKLKHTPRVILEAVYTHFANIEDTTNHEYADFQRYLFKKMVEIVRNKGFPILKKHAACTAAALLFPDLHFDMVRLGIGQYGYWPSQQTMVSYREKYKTSISDTLRPVLSWKTRISQIKAVSKGNTIGYGRTYKTTRDSIIAVLPIGYSDGYDRSISNQGYVLIGGHRAPIRGRICMNLMMVDVTDIPDVALEQEVVLIGQQGSERITAEDLAEWSGTIHYEILARLNPEIPRVMVDTVDSPDESLWA